MGYALTRLNARRMLIEAELIACSNLYPYCHLIGYSVA